MPEQSPDSRIVAVRVDVPSGTLEASPQIDALDLGPVHIISAQLIIPEGHAGRTGVAIVYDNQGIIPWSTPVDWIIGDGEETTFDVDFTFGHAGEIRAFNNGEFQHSFYWRFRVRDLSKDIGVGDVVPLVELVEL